MALLRSTSLASSPVISAKLAPVSVSRRSRALATSLLAKAGFMRSSCSSVVGSRSVLLLPVPLVAEVVLLVAGQKLARVDAKGVVALVADCLLFTEVCDIIIRSKVMLLAVRGG
jgi:hypothetical protein